MIFAKKICLPLALAGVVFCAHLNCFAAAAAGAPKAVIEEASFTFKGVLEGDIITHAYTIRNAGDSPLLIKSVRTNCGCTTAKKPEKIAPGQSDQIVVKGNTRGYGGHRFEKIIRVSTNDPNNQEIKLALNGPVERFVEIKPRVLNLRGSVGEELKQEFKIIQTPKYPFKVLAVEPDKDLKGKVDLKLTKSKNGYTIGVHNKVAEATRYRGQIIVKTDNPKKPEIELYVYCHLRKKAS